MNVDEFFQSSQMRNSESVQSRATKSSRHTYSMAVEEAPQFEGDFRQGTTSVINFFPHPSSNTHDDYSYDHKDNNNLIVAESQDPSRISMNKMPTTQVADKMRIYEDGHKEILRELERKKNHRDADRADTRKEFGESLTSHVSNIMNCFASMHRKKEEEIEIKFAELRDGLKRIEALEKELEETSQVLSAFSTRRPTASLKNIVSP